MYKVRKGKETWNLNNEDHLKAFLREGWELVAEEEKEVKTSPKPVEEEKVEATPEVHEEVPKKRTTRRKKAD